MINSVPRHCTTNDDKKLTDARWTIVKPLNPASRKLRELKPKVILAPFIFAIEGLRERTEHLDTFLFFCPPFNGVLFLMFCLLVEGKCQILVFYNITN